MLIQSYSVENDAKFKAQIENAINQVGDLRFAFGEIGRDWFKSNKAIFNLKGSGQYPDLSEPYATRKQRTHPNKPIMVRSGRMRDSITGRPNKDSVLRIGKSAMVMGSKVPYMIFHQSDEPREVIPLRKVLFLGAEAPRSAPSEVTGRTERFLKIIELEVERKLKSL